jgi:hypothetical protein
MLTAQQKMAEIEPYIPAIEALGRKPCNPNPGIISGQGQRNDGKQHFIPGTVREKKIDGRVVSVYVVSSNIVYMDDDALADEGLDGSFDRGYIETYECIVLKKL